MAKKRKKDVDTALDDDNSDSGASVDSTTGVSVGSDSPFFQDVESSLNSAADSELHFICLPLFHPRNRKPLSSTDDVKNCVTRSETCVCRQDWVNNVVGKVSKWINLGASSPVVRKQSEQALIKEYYYASHLGLQAILLPSPSHSSDVTNFSRCLQGLLSPQMPFVSSSLATFNPMLLLIEVSVNVGTSDGFHVWDRIRHLMGHEKRIFVALDISDLPKDYCSGERWVGEPVKALILETSVFFASNKDVRRPILSQRFRRFLSLFADHDVQIIIRGCTSFGKSGCDFRPYVRYVEQLMKRSRPAGDIYHQFCNQYYDSLRTPLQPLTDNLSGETYTVMEQDPVKYAQYENAIKAALTDLFRQKDLAAGDTSRRKKKGAVSSSSSATGWNAAIPRRVVSSTDDSFVIAMIVGPGRGPLVTATIRAYNSLRKSSSEDMKLRIHCVEKNPNAVVTLRNQQKEDPMWNAVDMLIHHCDMRTFNCDDVVDLLVSELLGSFGDNELSPECLDLAQKNLLREGGIVIPSRYTSFVAGLSSSRLWNSAKDLVADSSSFDSHIPRGLQIPYVVRYHNAFVCTASAAMFEFRHPNFDGILDNSRHRKVELTVTDDVTLHGLAGYFDCVLYKDIGFSTVPETHSPGMFSWFPMYFPVASPLRLRKGCTLSVDMWRLASSQRVWYEWAVCAGDSVGPIHNSNGVAFSSYLQSEQQ